MCVGGIFGGVFLLGGLPSFFKVTTEHYSYII